MSKVTTKIVNITAEYAKKLLSTEHESQMRRRNERHVANLARIMSGGNWQDLNGDTIVIDTDNMVIDGQHRLLAVIESGMAITTLLVTGVRPEAYYSIDLQNKTRGMRDVLAIDGYQNTTALATMLRNVWYYSRGISSGGRVVPAVQDLIGLLESDKDRFLESIKWGRKLKGLMSVGQSSFLYYIFSDKSQADAQGFFTPLKTGIGFKAGDPVKLLRDRLIADSYARVKIPKAERLGLAITAWNSYREGKHVRCLRWARKDGNKLPEVL